MIKKVYLILWDCFNNIVVRILNFVDKLLPNIIPIIKRVINNKKNDLLELDCKKKSYYMFINLKRFRSKKVKRFFNKSILLFINPFFDILKKGNFLTKKTIYGIHKVYTKKSNSELDNLFKDNKININVSQHYGKIEGIKIFQENFFDVNLFTAFTNGKFHDISLNKIDEDILKKLNLFFHKIPTMKINLKVNNLEKNKELLFPNKSLVKNYLPNNVNISINNNDIQEFDLEKAIELRSNQDIVMDKLGYKDYEFINKDNELYLVHKDDILKEGELIMDINFENAKKVTLEEAILIGEKIVNDKEIFNFLNVTQELKETYLKNSYDCFQYQKTIKKD